MKPRQAGIESLFRKTKNKNKDTALTKPKAKTLDAPFVKFSPFSIILRLSFNFNGVFKFQLSTIQIPTGRNLFRFQFSFQTILIQVSET